MKGKISFCKKKKDTLNLPKFSESDIIIMLEFSTDNIFVNLFQQTVGMRMGILRLVPLFIRVRVHTEAS